MAFVAFAGLWAVVGVGGFVVSVLACAGCDVAAFAAGCLVLALGFDAEDGPALVVRLGGLKGRRERFGAGLGSPAIVGIE